MELIVAQRTTITQKPCYEATNYINLKYINCCHKDTQTDLHLLGKKYPLIKKKRRGGA